MREEFTKPHRIQEQFHGPWTSRTKAEKRSDGNAELFTRGVRTHDATIKLVLDKSGAPEKQPVRHRVETYCQGK